MKRLAIFLVIICAFASLSVTGQNALKNKYYGQYKGKINAYKMETAGYLLEVKEAPIIIDLRPRGFDLTIGNTTQSGTYQVLFEAKDYLVLEGKLENQSVPERIVVYKKGKKISRDGLFPQPSALLYKE